jgi:hypothetical protein
MGCILECISKLSTISGVDLRQFSRLLTSGWAAKRRHAGHLALLLHDGTRAMSFLSILFVNKNGRDDEPTIWAQHSARQTKRRSIAPPSINCYTPAHALL